MLYNTGRSVIDNEHFTKIQLTRKENNVFAMLLNSDNSYPNFHINEIHRIIKSVLGNVDDRTVKKYVNCIKDFVKSATGLELGYNSSYNTKYYWSKVYSFN